MECIVAFWEGVLEGRLASRGVCFKGSGLVWWRSFLIDLGPNAGDDGLALCGKQATYYITCFSNPPVRGRGRGGGDSTKRKLVYTFGGLSCRSAQRFQNFTPYYY